MKKFLSALLAIILAILEAFTMVIDGLLGG